MLKVWSPVSEKLKYFLVLSLRPSGCLTSWNPPEHTQINYMVTDLEGGPRPSSPVEDSYRANILTVSVPVSVSEQRK